ncbi:Catalase HPII [compost metagenome]
MGVIVGSNFDGAEAMSVLHALIAEGLLVEFISEKLGVLHGSADTECEITHTFLTADSVLFDAIYALGGELLADASNIKAAYFIQEAHSHYKPIGASVDGAKWLEPQMESSPGVITGLLGSEFAASFIEAIAAHRHWDRI